MKQINPEYIESVDYKYMQEAPAHYRYARKSFLAGDRPEGWYLGSYESQMYAGFGARGGLWIGKDSIRKEFDLEKRYIMSNGKPFLKPYVDIRMTSGETERLYFDSDYKLREFLFSIKTSRFLTLPKFF